MGRGGEGREGEERGGEGRGREGRGGEGRGGNKRGVQEREGSSNRRAHLCLYCHPPQASLKSCRWGDDKEVSEYVVQQKNYQPLPEENIPRADSKDPILPQPRK